MYPVFLLEQCLLSAHTNLRDTAMDEVKHHNQDSDGLKETSNQCSCGVVFNWSNDAKGLTKTSVQEYEDVHKSLKTLCESQSGKQEQC